MTIKNHLYSIFLVLISIWAGWTLLVDFFIIPTVFSTVGDFFLAGDLGVAVFSKLNNLEVIASSTLLVITSFAAINQKKLAIFLYLALLLWIISMTYFTYLTPKLVELTSMWKNAEAIGAEAFLGKVDLQQEHQFYHKLYIGLDFTKMIGIGILLFLGIGKKRLWP